MSKQMQGKVCVITGGAGSIGAASAKLLLHEGAKVMLVDLSEAALKDDRYGGLASGDSVAWCAADVTKSDQVKNAIAHTVSRFGKIDVLFSNAGNFGAVAPIADYPEEVFDSVLAVHVKGAFLTAKHARAADERRRLDHHHVQRRGRDRRPRRLWLHHRQARPGRSDAGAGQGTRRPQHPRQHHSSRAGRQ
jgi:NAD(P)-dependent dehydrogenase (short-subunit alcohol dehydrogenase family)